MTELDKDKQEFIKELTELSKKYSVVIGGCGCCGSPWVAGMDDFERRGKYTLDEYGELKWS